MNFIFLVLSVDTYYFTDFDINVKHLFQKKTPHSAGDSFRNKYRKCSVAVSQTRNDLMGYDLEPFPQRGMCNPQYRKHSEWSPLRFLSVVV